MAKIMNFFAGVNSGEGFQNFFPRLMDPEHTYDFMILKGGPGVGKNTFMREIGRTMERAGANVEYLWCSGDPDSLDGVLLPDIGCGVVDGTSPHVMEAKFPAAVDRYVDLGRFYDLTAAKIAAEEIKDYTKAYQTAYARAYHHLKAARQVELDAVTEMKEQFDYEKASRRVEGIISRELRGKGSGTGRTLWRFLGSLTHKGPVWRYDSVETLCPKIYEFRDSWEQGGSLLRQIHAVATERGWDTILCPSPEEPMRPEHLLIPELELAFVTSRPGMEFEKKPYRRIHLDAMYMSKGEKKMRFQSKMTALLRQEAVAALQEAKLNHDKLEAVYNPYVDFEGVRAQAALEAGRLLSWLG